jgi:hypothetical protein
MTLRTQLLEEISVNKILTLRDIIYGDKNLFTKFEAEQEMRLIKNAFELADILQHEKFLRKLTEARTLMTAEELKEEEDREEERIDLEELVNDNMLDK